MNNNFNNNIIGYDSKTGNPIYKNETESNKQIIGYNPQTGEAIYSNQEIVSIYQNNPVNYASFGKRLGAYILESLFVDVIGIGIFIIFTIINFFVTAYLNINLTFISSLSIFIAIILIFFGQPIYCLIAESSEKHQTLGKKAMGIIVKNENGSYLSFGQSLGRFILKVIIPYEAIISIFTILFSNKKQALHDMILKMIVVHV